VHQFCSHEAEETQKAKTVARVDEGEMIEDGGEEAGRASVEAAPAPMYEDESLSAFFESDAEIHDCR
jgi:hypothetical protein